MKDDSSHTISLNHDDAWFMMASLPPQIALCTPRAITRKRKNMKRWRFLPEKRQKSPPQPQGWVSVSAMQPCSASFNSLPLPHEYNITNMTAAKRYESVWNAFLNELSHNPTATLTSFLKRCNVRQGRMKRWMENNGLSVKEAKKRLRDCQHDGIGDPMSPLSEDSGSLFLPMATDKPAPRSESCDILSGVSLTFPDGTQVNIKRGSAQAVMSFLKLYQREDLPCLD